MRVSKILLSICIFLGPAGCTHQQLAAFDRAVGIVNTSAAIAQRQEMIRQQEIANAQQQALIAQNAVALHIAQETSLKEQVKEEIEKAKKEAREEVSSGKKFTDNNETKNSRTLKDKKNGNQAIASQTDKVRCKIGDNPAIFIDRHVCTKAKGEELND